ncbi:MAG: hypothetical protein NZM27_12205 [Acetobacteraceae bacterium]|nr:hypothetical protein [Acetobacteraceae bacterium]MCX7684219.1 hypothetical protein [Acetobacteraceae bacterium]MDW8398752.1 hypothetical protein [Acetobacteraceae bacterium]
MVRLALLLCCIVALPAAAQRLDRPMNLAPLGPLPSFQPEGLAPVPNRGMEWPRAAVRDDLPRLEPTVLGTRDSASANALAPSSPGLQQDRLVRNPAPALRLTVPFRD